MVVTRKGCMVMHLIVKISNIHLYLFANKNKYSSLSIIVWVPSDHRHCYLFPALPTISLVVSPAAGHSAAPLHCSLILAIPTVFLTSIFGRRGCFATLAILAPQFWPLFGPSGRRSAVAFVGFDHRLAATTIDIALRPLPSVHSDCRRSFRLPPFIPIAAIHSDCRRSFRPLSGHCGHSSATPVARSIVDAIRLFFLRHHHGLRSLIPSPSSFVSISRTTLSRTFVLPHLIPRHYLAYCNRHLPHIVD